MKISSSHRGLIGIVALGVVTLVVVGGVTANKAVGIIRNYAAGLEVVKEDGPTGPDSPTYSCDLTTRYIDVSMCPDYATYANHPEVDSVTFFNNIINEVASNRSDTSQEVIIQVSAVNFGIGNGYINFAVSDESNKYANFTFTSKSTTEKPNFVPMGTGTQRDSVIFVKGNDNFTLKNIKITSNNSYKFTNAALYMRNNGGTITVDGYECGRVKGHSLDLASGCFAINSKSDTQPDKQPNKVVLKNSKFYDYYTGASIIAADSVLVENNIFDNTQASQYHDRGNLDLGFDRINLSQNDETSYVRNNSLKQGSGFTEGETAVGLLRVNNFELSNNIIEDTQDTGIFFSSHTPGSVTNPVICRGGSNNVRIKDNIMRRIKLGSIAVINLPLDDGSCTPTTGVLRNISITGNRISGGGTGIEASASAHAPIYNLEIANNIVSNKTTLQAPNELGAIAGACLKIEGLQGKNNDPNDIKIHDNRLTNCDLGIYFYASGWPLYDHIRQRVGPSLWDYTHGHSRPNNYISVYDNTIINNAEQADILVQNKPVQGVLDQTTIVTNSNLITSSVPTQGYSRCNIACNTDSDCNTPITVDSFNNTPDSTRIFRGYPSGYSCVSNGSGGKVCKNSQDTNDDNCDLNDVVPLTTVAEPVINPGEGQHSPNVTVTMSTSTPGATIRYTLDGTEPTANSQTYTTGFTLTHTTTVKAKAFKDGLLPSNTVMAYYEVSNPSASDLAVFAKGTRAISDLNENSPCPNGYPQMLVKYNNQIIGTQCLASTYPPSGYPYSIPTVDADPALVTIHFTNDRYVQNVEDRNLILDKVVLNNVTTVLPSSLVYAKGQWTSQYGCNNGNTDPERPASTSKMLNCNGYFRLRQANGGGELSCTQYDLDNVFDSRDGSNATDNRVKLLNSELGGNKLVVNNREIIIVETPTSSSTVAKCWGRVVNTSGSVVCRSNQVYCTWESGSAKLRGQDASIAGGCNLPPGTYKTEINLQNSASQVLKTCTSANFTVTQN